MSDAQVWMIALQVAGPAITVAVLLLANVRQSARIEERVKGLGRALDTHREGNARDHARYDRELAELQGRRAAGAD